MGKAQKLVTLGNADLGANYFGKGMVEELPTQKYLT